MSGNLINEFVDKKTINALKTLLSSEDMNEIVKCSVSLANFFGMDENFKKIADTSTDGGEKLVTSFHNNLVLLVQKTWVEKYDEGLKAQVLYQLDEFCNQLSEFKYKESYSEFFEIVDNVVYLMFGAQTKAKDFSDYALRIDPEFGIFWWYIQSLPRETTWSGEKIRIVVLLAMYFLANY